MSGVPLSFSFFLFIISGFGLAGNIRFIYCNYKNNNLHKQLLVILTVLQGLGCILEICDLVRIFLDIPLTRVSCIRFVGAPFVTVSFGNAIMYSLLGFEVLTLLFSPNLYNKMKVWWFHVVLNLSFIACGWWIYRSWTLDEDREVLLCAPPTALTNEIIDIRGWCILIINCVVLFQYSLIIVWLLAKRNGKRSAYTNKVMMSTVILTVVFIFSWFTTGFLVLAAPPISRMLNIPRSYIIFATVATAMITFCQTHYVYFFVSADNRKEFWKRGPIVLFVTPSKAVAQKFFFVPVAVSQK